MIWPALLFVPLQYFLCFRSMRRLGWNVLISHILTVVIAVAAALLLIFTQ